MKLLQGLKRLPKEHFSVYVGTQGDARYTPIAASPWSYYADPFIWLHRGRLWLLVEEFEYLKNRGRLCCIPLDDALNPGAPEPILPLACHASFPFVFAHEHCIYMVPETSRGNCVDLFVSEDFPRNWRRVKRLLDHIDAADTVIFQHEALWWMITSVRQNPRAAARSLFVYFSEDLLLGKWQPHPINETRRFDGTRYSTGRNGGAIIRQGDALLRLAQDNHDYYGQSIRVMQIDKLTPSEYSETSFDGSHIACDLSRRFSPHHISLHNDFIAFDVRDRFSYCQYIPFWKISTRSSKRPL